MLYSEELFLIAIIGKVYWIQSTFIKPYKCREQKKNTILKQKYVVFCSL